MCCNNRVIHWSTILFALIAAAVPTVLFVFGILANVFPFTIIAVAFAIVALLAIGFIAAFSRKRSSKPCERTNLFVGNNDDMCCCDISCICRYGLELLVYAGILLFVGLIATAVVFSGFFPLVVAFVALVSFFVVATLITFVRLINCYLSEQCDC